jgi:AcrR family transcriptional regulator
MERVSRDRTNEQPDRDSDGGPGTGTDADPDGGCGDGELRRMPVQRRSAERLALILDACAVLLDETGYERLSTRAVAARAGVPIGSVYRFFGNKRAMAEALARRNLDRYAAQATLRFARLDARDWRGAIDVLLDEYLAMKRTVPGFSLVDFSAQLPREARRPGKPDPGHQVARRLTVLLAAHLGRAPDPALHRTVLIAVEAGGALLRLAFRTDAYGEPGIIAEIRVMLRAYLARTLD